MYSNKVSSHCPVKRERLSTESRDKIPSLAPLPRGPLWSLVMWVTSCWRSGTFYTSNANSLGLKTHSAFVVNYKWALPSKHAQELGQFTHPAWRSENDPKGKWHLGTLFSVITSHVKWRAKWNLCKKPRRFHGPTGIILPPDMLSSARVCRLSRFSWAWLSGPRDWARQAPLSMGFSRILEWAATPSSKGSAQPRGRTPVNLTVYCL